MLAKASVHLPVGDLLTAIVSMLLLSLVAAGVYSIFGPFWSFAQRVLVGICRRFRNCHDQLHWNLGGFAGPYTIGFIKDRTGSMHWGLALVGVSMLMSAGLMALLPKRAHPLAR